MGRIATKKRERYFIMLVVIKGNGQWIRDVSKIPVIGEYIGASLMVTDIIIRAGKLMPEVIVRE